MERALPREVTHPLQFLPLYPALFVVGVVLHTYNGTDLAVPLGSAVRPILFATLVAMLIALVLMAAIGWHRAALAAMIVPLLLVELQPAPNAQVVIIAGLVAVGILTELVSRWRRRSVWPALTGYLTAMGGALVVLAVVTWATYGGPAQLMLEAWPAPAGAAASSESDAPNMYVVLLDGYPRADTIRDHLGNEDGLITDLEPLGFDHYPASQSNYPNTTLTTAALLNMVYVDELPGLVDDGHVPAPRQPHYRNAIADGAAFDVVREHGYQVVAIESGWDELTPTGADRLVRTAGLSQLEEALLRYSALGPILDAVHPDLFGQHRRGRIEQSLEAAAAQAESAVGPQLVWVHVPGPHFPLVYAEDGSPVRADRSKLGWFDLEDPDLLEHYRGNLRHLNKLVVAAVERIVVADPDAVVVLLSDHGSLLELGGWEETVRNLTLARTPRHAAVLGATPTPVNLFPRLFNAYLGTQLPTQPDRSWQVDDRQAANGIDWTLVVVR